MLNDDFTLEEFLEEMETYEFRHLPSPRGAQLLAFHHQALELAERAQGTDGVTFTRLAKLTGTGMQPGAFWAIVDWLGDHGLPTNGDFDEEETGVYLHSVGASFLRGYRAFGHDPQRWEELANQFVHEALPDGLEEKLDALEAYE